jgi:hypothetical protein
MSVNRCKRNAGGMDGHGGLSMSTIRCEGSAGVQVSVGYEQALGGVNEHQGWCESMWGLVQMSVSRCKRSAGSMDRYWEV